jgi:hypothetical protein
MNHPANNPPTVSSSRRRFLKQAVGASTVFAVPNIFTGSLFGLSGRAIAEPVSPWRMRLAFSSVMLAELPIEDGLRSGRPDAFRGDRHLVPV